jgi:hypothetical protein
MRMLWKIADFGRNLRRQMRFGELSRAPIRLLRVEWKGELAECDWMARPADKWDADLPQRLRSENATVQALNDAIALRELLLDALPTVESATLRGFRQGADGSPELIIKGTVSRGQEIPRNISSAAMRAKLLGLQFWLEDGMLEALPAEEYAMSF